MAITLASPVDRLGFFHRPNFAPEELLDAAKAQNQAAGNRKADQYGHRAQHEAIRRPGLPPFNLKKDEIDQDEGHNKSTQRPTEHVGTRGGTSPKDWRSTVPSPHSAGSVMVCWASNQRGLNSPAMPSLIASCYY